MITVTLMSPAGVLRNICMEADCRFTLMDVVKQNGFLLVSRLGGKLYTDLTTPLTALNGKVVVLREWTDEIAAQYPTVVAELIVALRPYLIDCANDASRSDASRASSRKLLDDVELLFKGIERTKPDMKPPLYAALKRHL